MNIYLVVWDNNEPWPEGHSERYDVIAAETEEQAIDKSNFKKECYQGSITADLKYSNVTLSQQDL